LIIILFRIVLDLIRISTGSPTLDLLMEGGIPKGFTIMLVGHPGTGKTILSSKFIYDGLLKDENGLFISFSESKEQFYDNSSRLGMNFEKFERQNKFKFYDFISLTKDGITEIFQEILSSIRLIKATRLVMDSFSALSLGFSDYIEIRNTIHSFLGKFLRSEGITSMLVMELPYGKGIIGVGVEASVVDGILKLEMGGDNASPFYLQILKMRGTKIERGKHVFNVIPDKGLILYPKHSTNITFPILEERVSSGIPGLDERINGNDGKGLVRGTLTGIIGASGSAKSTFGFQFIAKGVSICNENGIFCSLEDSADEIRRLGKGYGYDVLELEKNGLSIFVSNSEEENPDSFIVHLEEEIKRTGAKRLVIDGLSNFGSKYGKDINIITKRISNLIHKYQISTIITIYTLSKNEFNLLATFQNIILFRYVEVGGYMKRILLLLKVTAAKQDESILEFKISSERGGIEIVGPIEKNSDITFPSTPDWYN
jgi:circadian clock protein KaiC